MNIYLMTLTAGSSTRIILVCAPTPGAAKQAAIAKAGKTAAPVACACTPVDRLSEGFAVAVGLNDTSALDEMLARLPERPPEDIPNWTDLGALARAVAVLLTEADLSHDRCVSVCSPLLRELAAMHSQMLEDPHGDGSYRDLLAASAAKVSPGSLV